MARDKLIRIEKYDKETNTYVQYGKVLHAEANKNVGKESYNAGSIRNTADTVFKVTWNPLLEEINLATSLYRIIFKNHEYNLVDVDDFKMRHKDVNLYGELVK